LKMQHVVTVEYSPEKAGVGGSTPSLATIKSSTYIPGLSQLDIRVVDRIGRGRFTLRLEKSA